jgi:hypothetical protein
MSQIKVVLYLMWVAGEDVETQRRGLVVIFWPSINTVIMERNWVENGQKTVQGFPLRGVALHMCLANTFAFRMLKAQIGLAIPKEVRRRFQFHLGKTTENEMKEASFVHEIGVSQSCRLICNDT